MKGLRRIGQAVVTICLVVIIILAGSLAYSKWILKENPPRIFGYIPVTVVSGSMEPELNIGDVVLIKPNEIYQINDVVTYREENMLVTHRIVALTDQGFALQGDANNTIDSRYIKQEEIVGKVVMAIPMIGKIGLWLMTPVGILSVIVVAGIIYIIRKQFIEKKEAEV